MKKLFKKRLKFISGSLVFILTFVILISSVQGLIFKNQHDSLTVNLNQNNYNYENKNDFYAVVPASVTLPSVDAQGAILIDTKSGDIIYEYNSHKRLTMASTTKIMYSQKIYYLWMCFFICLSILIVFP